MATIDTGFLIALWNRDDAHAAAASGHLKEGIAASEGLRINPAVLSEASRVIRHLANQADLDGNRAAREFLHGFMDLPGAALVTDHADAAFERYLATSSLSYADAWVKEQAVRRRDACWSFDHAIGDL